MKRILAIWTGGLIVAAGAAGVARAGSDTPGRLDGASLAAEVVAPGSAPPSAVLPRTIVEPARAVVGPAAEAPAPVSNDMTGSTGPAPAVPAEAQQEPAPASDDSGGAHAAAPAPTRSPMPFDIIRTIQFLQDQVARGNGRAIRMQAFLLRRFAPVFLGSDRAVWSDARNARAAILFALSGGPPDVLRRLLAEDVFDEATKPIAEGALAYVTNDLAKAGKVLAPIDLAGVEPGLAAHLNLVLGQLQQNERPADAVAYLDKARLLAPGGLIEEAALRLEVVLVNELGDHDRADGLARQYFDRFSHSSYVGNFQARFALVYTERNLGDAPRALATVMDVTKALDEAGRRSILLAISRRSLVAGNLELARLSGAEALKIQGTEGEDRERGNLYAAAAGLAIDDPSGTAQELGSIDRSKLHPADADILDAARSVLSHMEDPAPEAGSLTAEAVESTPVFDRAQKLLDAVAGDLGDASK